MTDITELAQSLKAAAENAIGAHERLAAYPYGEIIDISQHEGEQIDIDITDLNEFNKEANPVNVLALVEALEKAQTINAAAEKLVRCKGRYHSEQNYRSLAALFGVTTPDLPPLEHENVHYADAAEMEIAALRQRIAELESRTVTIEPFRSFVTDADLAALHRFAECCDDPESGGHDLEKEQVRRLEEIGALRRSGHVHWITGFGDVMISITAGIKVEAE
ncbi:ead/Ea22-like family protein [Klebsiella sp. JB_Kp027]|uniref:ead/Ea22-like family protein n=1 Tax=Klebsiella sp. JB_Kp027 TaxID=3153379 RepID=UPI0032B44A78